MSLADQQWCPTSVQVTVLQARGLRIKGKGGTNDAYAIMQVAKEKYQTSVAEKSVAPVWKEEASFDLPQLLQPGTERTTLRVHVLHRALVGPDKLLGQAVINLKELSDNRTRNKSEWFKLLDKTGKADKDRGEVLVDIQFLRNNMTASMFDLSAAGKSRSRLGKFKDKVRGKKKELDTMSNVMPSFSQVLTDSEEEGNENAEVAAGKGEKKKKKIKSLFSPKSNLQRNMSQSMSVLPAKNSSMSGSQSSGLNMDFSEGKKRFKFKIHKRSDSRDSSSGVAAEQSNLCINGSHVYCEEPPPRTSRVGSNFSLASSGHGSMEDVPESSPPSVESLQAVRQYSPWTEEEEEETAEVEKEDVGELKREEEERMRRRKKEEEERARKQEEAERLAEEETRREEQERWRIEEEKKQREEEEMIRMEEEKAEEERRRQEEERRFAEEKRRLEEERRIEEEKSRKAEEERMEREERERKEEEERARREEEEQERLAEEKRRMEEEERRIQEEEERQREEEERIRMEEERAEEERRRQEEEAARKQEAERKLAEEKKRMEEDERKIREEEERQREEEERIRMEEERRRQEEEKEEARKQEVERKLAEEKKRMEEEERRIQEEEERQREEEERIRMEEQRAEGERRRKEREEKARKEEEEQELAEEKRRLEEEEKARREEERRCREEEEKVRRQEELEEKRRVEEQERRQREEEERTKREEEEERVRKEREEYERLQEEKRKLEEEEQKRIDEEKKRKEEEEKLKLEQERKRKEEEEKRQREEKEKHELLMAEEKTRQLQEETRAEQEKHGGAASTNPFDETFSNNPFEESHNSLSGPYDKVQQRSQSSGSLLGNKPASTDEKDVITAQREKRPAPQPPGERQSEREQDRPAQHLVQMNKPNKDKDVRTVSVPPQRSVQMIAPMSRSVTDVNTQSLTQSSTSKEATNVLKPGKRPAPTRPSSGAKTGSETKQERVVYGLNPFEDDEEETELTVQSDAPTTSSAQWPVAVSQAADKDAASQAKLKSSKKARAPLLPANTSSTSINQNTEGNSVPDKNGTAPDSSVTQHCDLKHTPESPGERSEPAVVQTAKEEARGKKEAPPTPSRRLLPVKPLNSLRQQSVPATQEEKEHRSAVLVCEDQEKTKVDETAPKGPFSQLSRQELISLVLKQETLLSQRDVKITELEQYIDNLLVRVIEEQPSILMSLKSKPV
ncbi:uncharacterized protein V6R79_010559 [Siganus canaliculatus]